MDAARTLPLQLCLPHLLVLFCIPGPAYYPRGQRAREIQRIRRHTPLSLFPLPYHHTRWETARGATFSLSLDWETTQHPLNALFRLGWEAYDRS